MEMENPVDRKMILSTLWIFYMFQQAYGDITTLYYSVFINHTPAVTYTNSFLLLGALLVEPAMAMILLSRVLKYRANRWANIIVGIVLTGVTVVSLFVGTPTPVYAFISAISIVTGVVVVWYAWTWPVPASPQVAAVPA
jgi:Family of unknown function (DUF6326)